MFSSEIKAKIFLLVIVIIILLCITIPPFLLRNNSNKDNFPLYDDIKLSNINFDDKNSESYLNFKSRLENDYLFKKESLINDYDSDNYDGSNIKDMVWNYVFSFELNNKTYLASKDEKSGKFCLNRRNLLKSFEELYNVNISNEIDMLAGFHEYISRDGNRFCFNYRNISNENTNQILLGIRDFSEKSGIITAKVYVYEFYSNESEAQNILVDNIKKYVSQYDFDSSNKVVEDELNGTINYKEIKFKVNNKAKFFKFQILSSKKLDY